MVNSVQDNGGVYFVPLFSGVYSPYWKDDTTGLLIGMSLFTEKGHILRALLESIAYRTRDVFIYFIKKIYCYKKVVETIEKKVNLNLENIKVDGGVTANEFLMQF